MTTRFRMFWVWTTGPREYQVSNSTYMGGPQCIEARTAEQAAKLGADEHTGTVAVMDPHTCEVHKFRVAKATTVEPLAEEKSECPA